MSFTIVHNLDLDLIRLMVITSNNFDAAVNCRLERMFDKIYQHLLEAHLITHELVREEGLV